MAKKQKKKNSESKPKRSVSWKTKLFMLVFCIGAVLLLKQSAMLLMVGMLPAIVAYIVDMTPGQAWFKTVFCFNLAGVLPYVSDLYLQGSGSSALQRQLGDFGMWLVVYLTAGAGWLCLWLSGKATYRMMRFYTQYRIDNHQRKLKKLSEEWNLSL